jgi:phosphate transport system protein
MPKIFIRELDNIKKMILSLGAMVEERVRLAAEAVENKDAEAAQRVVKTDYEIDEMEVEIEESCLKVMALHQPVAIDLRFLIAVIKINSDLERIGDQAVNIAQRVAVLTKRRDVDFNFDYAQMAEKAQAMLRMSLDALVNLDEDLAFKVVTMDDDVDQIQKDAYDRIKTAMKDEHRQNRLHDQPAADFASPGAPCRPCHQYR